MAITLVDLIMPPYLRISPTAKKHCGTKERLGGPKDGHLSLEDTALHRGVAQSISVLEIGRHRPEGRFPGRDDFHDHGAVACLCCDLGSQKPQVH